MAETNAPTRNALISVSDKTGIVPFAQGLRRLNWNIYASGGTAKKLAEEGVPVTDVAELVGGAAILGHRVVTLSREVHAGLLATDSPEDTRELVELAIPKIGLACVDMYPLRQAIADRKSEEEIIGMTDVGGPTMLRSAAKGRRIVLSRAEQRPVVLEWMQEGMPGEESVLRILAATAEKEVANYVQASAGYLGDLALGSEAVSSYERALMGILVAA